MGLFWDPDKKVKWTKPTFIEREDGCKQPLTN